MQIMLLFLGGWEGSAWFEMTFKSGGAIEIGQKLVELATRRMFICLIVNDIV